VTARLRAGSRHTGRVMRVEQYGAFVALAEGIEGLLHVSELEGGKKALRHAREAVKVGQEIAVTVNNVDKEQRRISLALARDDEEAGAAADAPAAPRSRGTFADLLRPKKK
jgi:small subunit ribosomal protein S1